MTSHTGAHPKQPASTVRRAEGAILAILALIAGVLLVGINSAAAAVEAAKSADRFVDSIGVNTHFGNAIYTGGNAYADPGIEAKLAELGVRHIRDHSWNDTALGIVDSLSATYGIRGNLILGETSRSPADLVNLLKAHPGYEAIEGLNEPDFNTRSYNGFTDSPSTNSYPATRAFQNDMFAAINADPQTQNVTVLSPAMGGSSKSQYLAPISFDVAAMHSYPSAREPSFNLDANISNLATLRGTKPLMSTETGYYNNPVQFGWIPENLAAKYVPRLYAEYFNRGIDRTYLYELANQGPDTTDREQNFGLLRFDLSEKPAFTALKNLIDLVKDPTAAPFTAHSLSYSLPGSSTLHHTLLEKSDGTFYLMVWQEVPVFNRTANNNQGAEITNAPLALTLTLSTDIAQARVFLPNNSSSPISTYGHTSAIGLSVLDQMTIVELTPSDALGDFNHDRVIDAADYNVWRKGFGTLYTQTDYDHWRAHFGQTTGTGSIVTTVPEPPSIVLLVAAAALMAKRRLRLQHCRKPGPPPRPLRHDAPHPPHRP
jgi:hypothetical protein